MRAEERAEETERAMMSVGRRITSCSIFRNIPPFNVNALFKNLIFFCQKLDKLKKFTLKNIQAVHGTLKNDNLHFMMILLVKYLDIFG